jgi:hypothetical protein
MLIPRDMKYQQPYSAISVFLPPPPVLYLYILSLKRIQFHYKEYYYLCKPAARTGDSVHRLGKSKFSQAKSDVFSNIKRQQYSPQRSFL